MRKIVGFTSSHIFSRPLFCSLCKLSENPARTSRFEANDSGDSVSQGGVSEHAISQSCKVRSQNTTTPFLSTSCGRSIEPSASWARVATKIGRIGNSSVMDPMENSAGRQIGAFWPYVRAHAHLTATVRVPLLRI